MAPPLFDAMQIHNALRNEALPALERLARNPDHIRSLARFDRDEPPPYVSSTEDEDDDVYEAALNLGGGGGNASDELDSLMEEPLSEQQLHWAAASLDGQMRVYRPGARYEKEVKREKARIRAWVDRACAKARDYFVQLGPARKGRAGRERVNIIARRNVKRRWQKLGVWNPEWGIPGRANNPQPKDLPDTWKWWWPYDDWHRGPNSISRNHRHPIARTLQLRRGMRRSEHVPIPPHPGLTEGASAPLAESFIMSRPWFAFDVQVTEEHERLAALPYKVKLRHPNVFSVDFVRERWEGRDDFKDHWREPGGEILVGWKWRNESPSPEPEDLSGLANLPFEDLSSLEDDATFELTPSEVDALEAIPPPSPDTPPPPHNPFAGPIFPAKGPVRGLKWLPALVPYEATEKLQAQPPLFHQLQPPLFQQPQPQPQTQAQAQPSQQPPQRSQRRRRRRHQRQPTQSSTQHLRRSARVAAIAARRSTVPGVGTNPDQSPPIITSCNSAPPPAPPA